MRETIPTITRTIPIRELRRCRFGYTRRQADGRLVGCSPEYAEVTRLETARGRFLSDADLEDMKNHCVLGAKTAAKLFPVREPDRPDDSNRRIELRGVLRWSSG